MWLVVIALDSAPRSLNVYEDWEMKAYIAVSREKPCSLGAGGHRQGYSDPF